MATENVFEHDNCVIDEHADRKGQAPERGDVQRATERRHNEKGTDGADDDVRENDHGRPAAAEKDQQRYKRENTPPE